MKGRPREMTEEWEAEICADVKSGMKLADLTAKHHIGKPRLYDIMYKNGITRQRVKKKVNPEKLRRYTKAKPLPPIPLTEEEIFERDFPKMWDEATKPFRDMIHQREKRTGVYWRWGP